VDNQQAQKENVGPFLGGVPEWPKGSDCKSDAQASLVRIQPPPPSFERTTASAHSLTLASTPKSRWGLGRTRRFDASPQATEQQREAMLARRAEAAGRSNPAPST